ncbi:MAG: ankyrin repeat domain-containing protein [Novosphingobium sp.]|uniref:ankyrin repeat domain-containing protein n=1 Tax=Novosphingobium sp. TaxID=1874826 RepID=UPI00301676F5
MRRLLALCFALLPTPALAQGVEALSRAIADDDAGALAAALAAGADANAVLDYSESPLARAVETQDPALVQALLGAGAKPDRVDALGVTPLLLACERGNGAIVGALLTAGADARLAGPDGVSPLAMCARFSDADAVRALVAKGADIEAADTRGQTPLMWAASTGRLAAVQVLVGAGARVNLVTTGGFTPLFFALASGNADVVSALIAAGADVKHRGPEGTSALQMALYQKNWDAAEELVRQGGGDVSELDREGRRPLHVAAAAGQGALVAALLDRGAEPDALSGPSRITWVTEANFGLPPPPVQPTTALMTAARAGQADVMWQLVRAGANEHYVDGAGVNLVLAAAQGRSSAGLGLALDLAGDANVADKDKTTALHMLAGGPYFPELPAMLRVLAAHGARTDLANARGKTALQVLSDGLATVQAAFHEVFPAAKASLALSH